MVDDICNTLKEVIPIVYVNRCSGKGFSNTTMLMEVFKN
jgi:hypothetical protein